MNKIMDVYIANAAATPPNEAYAALSLPAMPFEFFDALDKARVMQGDELYFEVSDYYAFQYMAPFIADSVNLMELNALCQKLSELDEWQATAFEGLLNMEVDKRTGPITVGKLIDLAYSTDCCHVVSEATSDDALGRFYAENGFISAVDSLPESTFKMLNFAYIGKEMRQGEGGVFTSHGYVVRHTEPVEAHQNMQFNLRTPDYQILLEDMDGNRFELPRQAPPSGGKYTCIDCRVPTLMSAIDIAELDEVNTFAAMLEGIGDRSMLKYKAVLHATGCDSLEDAVALADHLKEYIFDPNISSFTELAEDELNAILSSDSMELLKKHLNLYGYGRDLLETSGASLTSYGFLQRDDGQPIRAMTEQPRQGGMEMKMD